MAPKDHIQIVFEETMSPNGFMAGIRENRVDKLKFERLYRSVEALTDVFKEQDQIERFLVACLFEVPWEIENVIDHYQQQDEALARDISQMADKIRTAINDLLWTGLEDRYQ